MDWFISIAILSIAYAAWDINLKISNHFRNKSDFNPDFPFYSERDLWMQKIKMDSTLKGFNEKKDIYEDYWEKNKPELLKVKKNKDHSKEFKDIMHSYHYYRDEYNSEREHYLRMIEENFAIKNSKKTFKQMDDEMMEFPEMKKSGYDQWHEYEHKDQ